MRKRQKLKEGDVFYVNHCAAPRYRRIVGIIGEVIVYCIGGNRNYSCSRTTFLRWISVNQSYVRGYMPTFKIDTVENIEWVG